MKLFGVCLWHVWETVSEYYDCSDICIWSSGTITYRKCKSCNRLERADGFMTKTFKVVTNKEEYKEFENIKGNMIAKKL